MATDKQDPTAATLYDETRACLTARRLGWLDVHQAARAWDQIHARVLELEETERNLFRACCKCDLCKD